MIFPIVMPAMTTIFTASASNIPRGKIIPSVVATEALTDKKVGALIPSISGALRSTTRVAITIMSPTQIQAHVLARSWSKIAVKRNPTAMSWMAARKLAAITDFSI